MARRRGVRVALAAFGVLLAAAADAEAQVTLEAPSTVKVGDWELAPTLEVRARGEYRRDPVDVGGTPGPRVRDNGAVFERARVGLGAEQGALKAQVTLQDARAWGILSPSSGLGENPSGFAVFGAYEAYGEAHTASARPSFLRVGRQAVQWGEGRLLGVADWAPAGRSLDAARGRLSIGDFDVEVLAAMLAASRPLGASVGDTLGPSSGGTQLYGAQIAWLVDPLFNVQLFGFARVAREGGTANDGTRSFANARAVGETFTGAARLFGAWRSLTWSAEGAYQAGKVSGVGPSGLDRAAYAATGYVAYKLDDLLLTPTLRVGGALASGDDGRGKYKQFDPILPDVHVFHGAMDIFAWSNLVEANARLTTEPWTEAKISLEYRYARLYEASGEWLNAYLGRVGSAPGNTAAELGHELDLWATWTPWAPLQIVAGYSALLLGDGARTIMVAQGRAGLEANGTLAPESLSHLAYVQATLRIP